MTEERVTYKPGQKVLAKVNGRKQVVVLSLETEEKGDRRMFCWRYDKPYYPVIPKDVPVEPIGPYLAPIEKRSRY